MDNQFSAASSPRRQPQQPQPQQRGSSSNTASSSSTRAAAKITSTAPADGRTAAVAATPTAAAGGGAAVKLLTEDFNFNDTLPVRHSLLLPLLPPPFFFSQRALSLAFINTSGGILYYKFSFLFFTFSSFLLPTLSKRSVILALGQFSSTVAPLRPPRK